MVCFKKGGIRCKFLHIRGWIPRHEGKIERILGRLLSVVESGLASVLQTVGCVKIDFFDLLM
jgi:hypothetical protein